MKLLTTGEIAKQLNIDRDRVSYALRKLAIVPTGTAGQARVFPETAIAKVREFINSKSVDQAIKDSAENEKLLNEALKKAEQTVEE